MLLPALHPRCRQHPRYAPTAPAGRPAIRIRACYAMSGTRLVNAAIPPRHIQYSPIAARLRAC
eukprot:1320624-Rhodomonas_salina.4